MNYNDINLLQAGDNVQIKRSIVEWWCNNLVWIYGCKRNPETEKFEFREDFFPEVRGWLHLYLTNHNPSGYIVGYGAEEDYSKRKNIIVAVDLPFKKEKYKIIVKESDVKILSLWR